jgi:hypothetical protein
MKLLNAKKHKAATNGLATLAYGIELCCMMVYRVVYNQGENKLC